MTRIHVFCFVMIIVLFASTNLFHDISAVVRCPNGSHRSPSGNCESILGKAQNLSSLSAIFSDPEPIPASSQSMIDYESSMNNTVLNSSADSMLAYQDISSGMKILYPANWTKKTYPYSELNTINRIVDFESGINGSESLQTYGPFVTIKVEDVSDKNVTLKSYIREKFDNDVVLSMMNRIGDNLSDINGQKVWQVEWENPYCCKWGHEHGLEAFVLLDGKVYRIEYEGGNNYLAYFPEFLRMLHSMEIERK